MDLIHTDVCTIDDRTLGSALYFIMFINDHSRKAWTSTLKFKDEVLDILKHFPTSVEREIKRQLKCIQVDNGGEYMIHLRNIIEIMGSCSRKLFLKHLDIMKLWKE